MQIWRTDRFSRGGDHIPFLEMGYPAARISVAVENYDWQHQDLRTEKGKVYGDTVDHMDFPYLEKVTKLNVAALAAIASAPPPPEPKVEGGVSTDTTVTWWIEKSAAKQAAGYVVRWRRTDSKQWEQSQFVSGTHRYINDGRQEGVACYDDWDQHVPPFLIDCSVNLKGVRVDDWVFGVSSISKDGFESPVASAVPGGAFKPYVAPPPSQ
jgi:hypothetical protein